MTVIEGLRIDSAGLTDTGRVRSHNEDALLSRPDLGLWVVADGMGGHAAGDYASGAIVDAVGSVGLASSLSDLEARFQERLSRAHAEIEDRAGDMGATIGATVVAMMMHQDGWTCGWSGDSRMYRLRGGTLEQVSEDHSEVQELLSSGSITPEEAAVWPRRNTITRAVGVTGDPICDLVRGDAIAGDVFLLCSDGLNEHLEASEIAAILSRPGAFADELCTTLVDETLVRGARDNVTCIVVRLLPD